MGVISIGMILGFEVKGKIIRPHTVRDFGRKGFVDSLTPGKCSAKETRSVCLIKNGSHFSYGAIPIQLLLTKGHLHLKTCSQLGSLEKVGMRKNTHSLKLPPSNPVIFSDEMMIRVSNHLLSKVSRFHAPILKWRLDP